MNSMQHSEHRTSTLRRDLRELGMTAVASMLAVLLMITFVVRPIRVEGNSMYPTLESDSPGFSNIIGLNTAGLKRFDIAVIRVTGENSAKCLVKRVIGLPGETISYKGGVLLVNGQAVDEPFLNENFVASYGGRGVFMGDVAEITLGSDEYYCLGDNRPNSRDSRYYGPFKRGCIICKGAFILLPIKDFGVKTW